MSPPSLSEAEFDAIVSAGIQAPSADNRHLLQFEVHETSVLLWGTDAYFNAPYHRRALSAIGFGAVVENMFLRGCELGWTGRPRIAPKPRPEAPIARIDFERVSVGPSELSAAISERHTNRHFFSGPKLSAEARRQIELDVAAIADVTVHWFDTHSSKRRLARIAWKTEAARFCTESLHEELFASIRFDVGWDESADEGLPPAALAIERPLRPAFASLRHKPVMRVLSAVGVHRLIGLRAGYFPCVLAPTLAVLACSASDVQGGCWAVGRALERLWLRATLLRLAVQPLVAPGLYALADAAEVPPDLRRGLAEAWRALVPSGYPLVALRLGQAKKPAIRTGRRPSRDYFRVEATGQATERASEDAK